MLSSSLVFGLYLTACGLNSDSDVICEKDVIDVGASEQACMKLKTEQEAQLFEGESLSCEVIKY